MPERVKVAFDPLAPPIETDPEPEIEPSNPWEPEAGVSNRRVPELETLPARVAVVEVPSPIWRVPDWIIVVPDDRLSTPENCTGALLELMTVMSPAPLTPPVMMRPVLDEVLLTVIAPWRAIGMAIRMLEVLFEVLNTPEVTPDPVPPVNSIVEELEALMPNPVEP